MLNHFIAWTSRYETFVDCCCNVNRDNPPAPRAPGSSKCGRQLKAELCVHENLAQNHGLKWLTQQ